MKPLFPLLLAVTAAVTAYADVPPAPPLQPTVADVAYGPHEKTKLDFYRAPGDTPRPLLVMIHGGGWIGGDKKVPAANVLQYLNKGISFASINYRLTGEAPLPAPVHDAARAIQFIRTKATEWNINPDRIVLVGGSAGACTAMWLLFHDDLADPTSADPVARQSTRVHAAFAEAGQTSIDPKVIEGWLGPNVNQHPMIYNAVAEATLDAAMANYAKHEALFKEFSPYNHVDKNDPPLYMTYKRDMTLPSRNASHGIHHPVYGVKLKEKCDEVGSECYLDIEGQPKPEKYRDSQAFLHAKLLE